MAIISAVFRQATNYLVLSKGLEGQYKTLDAFLGAGKKLGVVKEYFYGKQVMALITSKAFKKQIRDSLSAEANMKRVVSGRIDGALVDALVAGNLKRQMNAADKVAADLIVVSSENLHVLFSKASVEQQTVDDFNTVLARLEANGTLQKISDRYLQ